MTRVYPYVVTSVMSQLIVYVLNMVCLMVVEVELSPVSIYLSQVQIQLGAMEHTGIVISTGNRCTNNTCSKMALELILQAE